MIIYLLPLKYPHIFLQTDVFYKKPAPPRSKKIYPYSLYKMIKQIAIAAITMLMLDGVYLNAMSTQYGEQIAKVQRTALTIKMSL